MAKRSAEGDNLVKVADAIREKGDTSDTLSFPDGMVSAIRNIECLSTCIASSFIIETTGVDEVKLPVTGLTKLQSIYLFRPDYSSTADQMTIDSLFIVFASDGSTIEAVTSTSINTNNISTSNFRNLNSDITLQVIVTSSGIEIYSHKNYEGYFFGKYYYCIYGY